MAEIPTRQFLENSIVIWLNPDIDDIQQSIEQLRQVINVVEVFNDEQSFINYVVDVVDERILLIITKNISETTIELIRQLSQIDSIYLFSSNKSPNYISNIRKFKGIVHDTESLYQMLRSNIRRTEHENVTFNLIGNISSLPSDQTNRQEAAFMYTQLLKDIFIEMKDDSKDEMTSFCQEQYADNTSALQFISEFEKNYEPNQAINWYTRESFLYKILNKALRTQNIEVLYKIRTFIRNLHFHLLECYQEQNNNSITRILYRGQCMSNNEFKKLQNNKDGLLSVSNFFSTTEDKSLAMIYAGVSNDDETAMVFEIKIEPSLTDIMSPFANIQEFSNFGQAEKEWLFSFGSVFRIVDIKEGIDNQPWYIHLLLTNEFDQELKMMTEHFRSDISIGLLLPIHSLGKLSYKMGNYMRAIEYYQMALESESAWRGKIMIVKEIGQTYERLALFDNALACFDKALSMHEKLNDKQTNDYHRLAAIYVGVSAIYTAKQDKDKSLHYLNEALNTELSIEQPNKEIRLNCYNDIGFIHFTKEKYDESLLNYQKALDIGMEIYPATHPNIGTIYMNIGNIYQAQKRYKDALENLRKSLDIQLASLPVDHPDIARSFNNISGIYHSMGRYEDALTYCKNALNIYLKRMPENHPNLAVLYNNMIELYDKLGLLNESLDYRYKKLDIYLATLQPDDTKIGITYNTIAATLAALRRFDEAAEYALKAHEFTTRVFGANHPATQTCAKNLEEILNRQ
jgi:tetratricopeptide (TPR) repeat protein